MAIKAHVGFSVPNAGKLRECVVSHFCRLGYRLVEDGTTGWVFHRGNKLATLWRFDIRAYDTTLRVHTTTEPGGSAWVSCDWDVYTLMTIATGSDTATLEAEGRELESALRHQV